MSHPIGSSLSRNDRRRAMRLGIINGGLWAIGNGLTTGTIIYYLALELGAGGLGLSLILAAPSAAAVLQLVAPLVISACGGVKPACIGAFVASYLLLPALAVVALPGIGNSAAPAVMIALICVHQLLEYIGAAVLWSWLATIVHLPIRGRYIGRREMWKLIALLPSMLAGGRFVDVWWQTYRDTSPDLVIVGYMIPITVGALFLLLSIVPLMLMPAVETSPRSPTSSVREIIDPFRDRRFARLLLFGCWFSFFAGLTGAAQNIYPKRVLGLGVFALAAMRTVMRLGQIGLSPLVGKFVDRFGNRPALILAQLLVACGPASFLLASPETWWLLWGAWLLWIAYVGLNVGLPNLMLKLAPGGKYAAYVASYYAVTSLCHAISVVLGGLLYNYLSSLDQIDVAGLRVDHYQVMFWAGWMTRLLGVVWLVRIIEPGAWRWRDILAKAAPGQLAK